MEVEDALRVDQDLGGTRCSGTIEAKDARVDGGAGIVGIGTGEGPDAAAILHQAHAAGAAENGTADDAFATSSESELPDGTHGVPDGAGKLESQAIAADIEAITTHAGDGEIRGDGGV